MREAGTEPTPKTSEGDEEMVKAMLVLGFAMVVGCGSSTPRQATPQEQAMNFLLGVSGGKDECPAQMSGTDTVCVKGVEAK